MTILTQADDDQSIYGFRGADPGMLQSFLRDHPEAAKYELSVNYRCTASAVFISCVNQVRRLSHGNVPGGFAAGLIIQGLNIACGKELVKMIK